jgi:nucleoside-diphosphate-sugar epimerase
MTKVIVTGGSGKLGRACVDELLHHNYEVVILDAVAPRERKCVFTATDLTDFGQTLDAFMEIDAGHKGVDAVVHLGAIPGPSHAPNAHTFLNNVACSFNVFQAARLARIKNVVWASSETLLGVPFDEPPPYVPVDEDYPSRPEWTYAMAKLVDETLAREFCRWDPDLKMIGLRFSNVMEPSDYANFPAFDSDPWARKWNLWAYIDARDGAQAIRLALEHPSKDLDVFVIANADTVMSRPNKELMEQIFPNVPFKRPVGPNETLLSIEKARRVLGYEPRHSWRGVAANSAHGG